ncbi:hypothetical protein [Spiroplasma cantharicola]|uniref:Uncharacterized protein n=1 Tax=Spiroplasma cantharicola TaxID=362837 RepID=A0A0M4JSV0_9MOLU|nr:hypothetical protein [Spiroplasma cantharicola]ALD66697.1 hypothetical protein SCANT_v1c07910 [Spiroplasma cantharicola]
MANKDFKNIYNYQPLDPHDPKMPSLTKTPSSYEKTQTLDLNEHKSTKEPTQELVFESDKPKKKSSEVIIEGLEDSKKSASSIISKLKKQNEITQTTELEPELVTNDFVFPDPKSELNILNSFAHKRMTSYKELNETKARIKMSRGEVRIKLTQEEIQLVLNKFKAKVVKVTQKEVVLKNNKYGFEIYRNGSDKRYWVVATCFEEIWDPKSTNYMNLWTGNSFTGYGFHNFNETLEQTETMMTKGKTGWIMWKDHVIDWNKDTNRFYSGSEPKQFSYNEYKKIVKWYKENKIWILVKQEKVKDIEDLMEENKEKRRRGEKIPALSTIQEKLLQPPRKASLVYGYPVANPNYKGKDYVKPENKLYQIGFAYSE